MTTISIRMVAPRGSTVHSVRGLWSSHTYIFDNSSSMHCSIPCIYLYMGEKAAAIDNMNEQLHDFAT